MQASFCCHRLIENTATLATFACAQMGAIIALLGRDENLSFRLLME
jgi:hypothetical protein